MPLFLKRMGREETFYLSPDKEKILIGRSAQCDISFPSLHISRQHCQIIQSPPNGALVIKNIRDTNCTYVNELKLQNPDVCAELQVGCRIGLGVPLELATEDGMRNNNYVFLKLEGSQSSLQTRQNEARTTEEKRNIEVGVHSQPGDPPPVVTLSDYPPEATCVQVASRICLISGHAKQEERVPTEGLRPFNISSIDDLNSELVPTGGIYSTSYHKSLASPQNGKSQTSCAASASNALGPKGGLQRNNFGSGVGSAKELRDTRQPESNTKDSDRVKPEIVANENFAAPMEALGSSLKPKQVCSREDVSDLSLDRKVDDQKAEASVSKKLVSEPTSFCDVSLPPSQSATSFVINDSEGPSSPMSVDLTQADPESPTSRHFTGDSSKKEQPKETIASNLISSASPDVQIISSPEISSQEKGKELPGKRKRFLYDEPPNSTSEAEDVHCVSIKKKVRSSSSFHASKDIVSTSETLLSKRISLNTNKSDPNEASKDSGDSGNEALLLTTTDQYSNKCDVTKVSEDSDNGSEPLFQIDNSWNSDESGQSKALGDSDSDSEPLFCKKNAEQNSNKCTPNKPSENCDSEIEPLVCIGTTEQNSDECNSQKASLDSDSDSDSLFLKRKFNHLGSKCDLSKTSADSSSDNEPLLHKRKPGCNPRLICSSDDDSDIQVSALEEKTHTRKSVEKMDDFSCFSVHTQNCTVKLNKLPSYVSKDLTVAVSGKDYSASSNQKENKITGDEKCINDSDRSKFSQKCHDEYKRKKRKAGESNLPRKYGEGVILKHTTTDQRKYNKMQSKSLGEHSSHTVIKNTTREDQREGTGVPSLSGCISSAPSVSSISADSEQSNKVIEANKVSYEPSYKDDEKSEIKEPSKTIVEVSTEIKVKTEPGLSFEENVNSAGNDAEKDDVVFMYSQVGEEIWLSSDEEEETPSPPVPASTSLDEELDLLFVEEDEQKSASVEVCSSSEKIPAEVDGSEMDDHYSNDDEDQWFPVLSQSFLESSDEEDNKDEECNKDSKNASLNTIDSEPSPGPSGLSKPVPDSEENESDEWWPILSQGFFDDNEPEVEEKEDDNDEVVIRNNSELENEAGSEPTRAGGTSDLRSIIEKLKKKSPRTSQLTEAKIPLQNSRKNKQKRSTQVEVSNLYKTSEPSATVREKGDQKKKKQKQSVSGNIEPVNRIGKKNKSPDLRKTLTCKFNLESYKTTIECRTKEKHHLVSKNKGESNRPPSGPPPCKSANERTVHSKDIKNISIQKKAKPVDPTSQDKVHSKVAAKVTKKSRFEKLIDCDIFSKPTKSTVASKRNSFKIPKSSGARTTGTLSVHSEVQGCGSVLDKRKNVKAGNSSEPVLPNITEPQSGSSSENMQSEKQTLPSSSAAIRNETSGRTDEISKDLQRVKLKSKPKSVHFPQKEEDLVKVLLISPQRKGERTGQPTVRARETLPEELMLQRQNIPPYYMELFVHQVCHWNYDWLECYHTAQEKHRAGILRSVPAPPPVVSSTNYPTLILYSSYNDYKETHSSLFYLELWERIYRDWVQSKYKNCRLQALIEFVKPAFIKTPSGALKFWAVKLMVAIPQAHTINFQDFRQGTLISLKVRKEAKKSVIFGYIDYMMVNNRQMVIPPQNQGPAQMSHSFSLGVRVAKETIQTVKPGTVVTISCVSYIRPNSRIWEGLCKLPLSPLCKDILSPSLAAFSCERETKYLVENLPLNEVQEKAVTTVSSKCMYDSHIPKLSLIHGPPGTGKTSTVVALVAQMVMMGRSSGQGSMPHCRVLICAPSNAAVDELTLRLIRLRDIGLSLRVVRVGFKVSDHPLVRSCTLDQFVSKQIKMEISTPRCESAKQEWQRRKILVQQVAEELEKARKEGRHSEIRQLEVRLNEMARAKAEFEKSFISQPSTRERFELQQKWQQEFLLKAEVVTTTLNSCVSGIMAEVLSKHLYHFTCCIVDEAGQCQETETLLPLLLGIRKMVLVGDHHQLPATVLSQLALSKNLKQSLFERMHHRLVLELQREDVVHTLSMQYRMHPEIVQWPAHHFYMNKLTTSPELTIQANISLKPYMIFDLKSSQEQRLQNQEMYNPAEASLVYVLLEVLQPHLSHKTVGIITPYQRQRIYLEEKLARFKGIINLSVNTIDGFQGQERDVIILSFVRANNSANIGFLSHRQRLNVALTRAKKICYIIASLSSLEGNEEWNSLIRNGRMRGLVCPVASKEENDKNFLRSIVESQDYNLVPKNGAHS